jgi:hypothetical protein
MSNKTEQFDYAIVKKIASRDPRKPGMPPHHLRCDWTRGDWPGAKRCILASGHSEKDHQYEDDADVPSK